VSLVVNILQHIQAEPWQLEREIAEIQVRIEEVSAVFAAGFEDDAVPLGRDECPLATSRSGVREGEGFTDGEAGGGAAFFDYGRW